MHAVCSLSLSWDNIACVFNRRSPFSAVLIFDQFEKFWHNPAPLAFYWGVEVKGLGTWI